MGAGFGCSLAEGIRVENARRPVGAEYIVDAATWLKNNNNAPLALNGQEFESVAAPNRFHLADFFELHVWAWRDNPPGAFVDRKNRVTYKGQIRRSQSSW